MMRKPSDSVIGTMAVCLPVLLLIGLFWPGTAVAGHKLADSQCVDCHVTGGSLSNVVNQSRLIRIDNRMSEIVANVTNWNYGNPLPCIYCHDKADKSVRENMIGVWNDFTNSISSHPVDAYDSNIDGAASGLDCIDCHDPTIVYYVKGGGASSQGTALSPNIHERNVAAVTWTPESAGLLTAADTFRAYVASATSPYNAGGNTFCTEQCHDANPGTGYNAQQAAHGYTSPIVSLENGSNFFTASDIQGCLNETATGSGCHAVHKSESTDLITILEWGTSNLVGREDCGACHVFDDASAFGPLPRANSDFYTDGHGQFAVACLTCHDKDVPHFTADGTPATGSSAGRLNFILDSIPSGFSTPDPNSRLSICVSSNCHSGYKEHAPSGSPSYPVACLDCHDPHGYGVGSNIMMMRETLPVASPASTTLHYQNSGEWYNSAQTTGYTFYGCDSSDCHPESINAIMDTTGGNPVAHGGGTGLKSGCVNCHKHTGGEYSWAATGCDQCHGAAGSYWPSDTSSPDDGGASPDNAGRHPIHRQALASALGYAPATTNDGEQKTMCRYCHKVGDADHTSSTRANVFENGNVKAIWDTPSEPSSETDASFVAGTDAGTCNDVDCHNNKATASPYLWYESGTTACVMCHTVGTGNASAFVDPVSGLHDESPRVSGVTHDDSFAYSGSTADCTTCHTSDPSSSHLDGTSDASIGTTGNTAIAFTAGVGFADSTVPPTCAVSIAGCHLEADVGETWKRLWTENADQTDGTECAGCHGDFTTGWTSGVMHATAPSTKGNGTHTNTGLLTYECTDCHAIGDATPNYAFTSSTNDWNQNAGETSNHGNALITMNDNTTSWARSGGTESGCSNSCHSAGYDATHGFTATGWTPETVTGDVPPVGCDGCHGASGLYWPQTASALTSEYPDRTGTHGAHIDALESKFAYNGTPDEYTTNDAQQRHMCEYCHNDANGVGGSDHWDYVIPADVGSFNGIWSTSSPAPGATDADGIITGAKTCQDVDCHYDGSGTETTPDDWYTGGTADCTYCHEGDTTYTTGGLPDAHDMHADEAGSGGYDYTCVTCHQANTENWHADGQTSNSFNFSGLATTAGFSSPAYSVASKSCDNVYCHGLSAQPDWDNDPSAACGTCHGDSSGKPDTPASGGSHTSNAHSAAAAADCTKCHENTSTDTAKHAQGPADAEGAALVSSVASSITAYSYGAHLGTDTDGYRYSAGTCSTDCHSDGTWGGTGGCTFCHGASDRIWPQDNPGAYPDRTGEHAAHIDALEAKIGYDSTPGVYTTNDAEQKHLCAYCHSYSSEPGEAGHGDNVSPADVGDFNPMWDTALYPTTSDANGTLNASKTCSDIDCHYDSAVADSTAHGWYDTPSGDADCAYCHVDQAATYASGDLPNYHDTHVNETGDGGYDYSCEVCHNSGSYTNWHANGSAASDVSFIGTAIAAGFAGASYNSAQMTCSTVYCHGGATPDWNGGAGQSACGTCHGDSSGKPNTPLTGGSHTGDAHSAAAAADCTRCHENTNTDTTKHAKGPANAEGVALVSSVASSITAYSYGAHLGTDTDGYRYSAGNCTATCHGSATWGAAGGCTMCHGGSGRYWPQDDPGSYSNRIGEHAAHIDALEDKIGYDTTPGVYTTNDAAQKHMCKYCHTYTTEPGETGHGDNVSPADVGDFNPIWDTADPPVTSDVGAAIASSKACNGIDCHYNTTTAQTWYGLGNADCAYCHAYQTTYTAGSLPAAHDIHVDEAASGGYDFTCAVCHSGAASYAQNHQNGVSSTDVAFSGTPATTWSATYTGGAMTCANLYCHGSATPDWNAGTGGACGDCHGDPADNGRPDGGEPAGGGNHDTGSHLVTCGNCHPHNGGYGGGEHVNGPANVNGDAMVSTAASNIDSYTYGSLIASDDGFRMSSGTCNTTLCHGDVEWGSSMPCTGCHDGSTTGNKALAVNSSTSSHIASVPSGSFAGCEFCHFSSHGSRTTGTVAITWDARTMGANYATDSTGPDAGDGKIYLKKVGGSEANEAEICWGCHDQNGDGDNNDGGDISEWNATWGNYTTGYLSGNDWTGGVTWTSNNFGYKSSAVRSVHETIDSTSSDPTIDTSMPTSAGNISCTSCHDVHLLGNNGYSGATTNMLRGTWTSNPFPEDGAPLSSGQTINDFGGVPRAGSGTAHPLTWAGDNEYGGWQIEQNNSSFSGTYGQFGGLCQLCHTQSGLESMSSGWTGHINAVSGFSANDTSNNVYRTGLRGGSGTWQDGYMRHDIAVGGDGGTYVYGLRNAETKQFPPSTGAGMSPLINPIRPQLDGDLDLSGLLGVTVDNTTYDVDFHNFPCSKCHNPHASRLPRLMITNCLDVSHNTWDNSLNPSGWSFGSYNSSELAYSPTATNCHRYVSSGDTSQETTGDPGEPGWNSVTPW